MPGFDGTGPDGAGSMTGAGRGYCIVPLTDKNNSNQMAGFINDSPGSYGYLSGRRNFRFRTPGRGHRRGYAHRR